MPMNSAILDIERETLAVCLFDNGSVLEVSEHIEPKHLSDEKTKAIFELMLENQTREKPFDEISLINQAKSMGAKNTKELQQEINNLDTYVVSLEASRARLDDNCAAIYEFYVNKEAATRARELLDQIASGKTTDYPSAFNSAAEYIESLQDGIQGEFYNVRDILKQSVYYADDVQSGRVGQGLKIGFADVDELVNGLEPGVHILAGRPGMGKTSLAHNIILSVLENYQGNVAMFSLEMSPLETMLKMLCTMSGNDINVVKRGSMNADNFKQFVKAAEKLGNSGFKLYKHTNVNISQVKRACRKLHRKAGLNLIVIDYLQLMQTDKRQQSREREIADLSRSLQQFALKSGVPVLLLTQLNRQQENRTSKKPQLSDLRESGAIEQDAYTVSVLWQEEQPFSNDRTVVIDLELLKNRGGPTGNIKLVFEKSTTRFRDHAKVNYEYQ